MPFSVEEFAAIVKKHPDTVRKWCRLGTIKAKRIGRDWYIDASEDPRSKTA